MLDALPTWHTKTEGGGEGGGEGREVERTYDHMDEGAPNKPYIALDTLSLCPNTNSYLAAVHFANCNMVAEQANDRRTAPVIRPGSKCKQDSNHRAVVVLYVKKRKKNNCPFSHRFVLGHNELGGVVPDVQQGDQPSSSGKDQNSQDLTTPTQNKKNDNSNCQNKIM